MTSSGSQRFTVGSLLPPGTILCMPTTPFPAPRKGMPEGHLPVRSYLALPVISNRGTVIGGLFFGHPGKLNLYV